MGTANPEKQYIVKSELKSKQGWTEGLIKRFLPEPDETEKNPHYSTGSPMLLYDLKRVSAIEEIPEFKERMTKILENRESRKASARQAVKTKQARLIGYVEEVRIDLPVFSKSVLIKKACRDYNDHQEYKNYERGS